MEQMRCYGCMAPKAQTGPCPHCGYDSSEPIPPHILPPGTLLQGQYLVGKLLGQGGFGITYIGWDTKLEHPVAIKEYFPSGAVMRDTTVSLQVHSTGREAETEIAKRQDRFLREARTLAQFNRDPNIVHVSGFFRENGTAYIIMEYVDGITLKHHVKSKGGTLPPEEVFSLLTPVFQGLSAVHSARIVHRDISPDNIMLTSDGGVKLIDFGAVRYVQNADAEKPLTKSTEAILKHGYAPIEQYQNKGSLGPWSDVYALCATIYYCLTGEVPPSIAELMLDEEDVNWQAVPGLTQAQKDTLAKGMAKLPKHRIQNVRALAEGLGICLDPSKAEETPEEAPKPEEKKALKKEEKKVPEKPVPPKDITPSEKTLVIPRSQIRETEGLPGKKPPTVPPVPQPKKPRKRKKVFLLLLLLAAIAGILALRPAGEPTLEKQDTVPTSAPVEIPETTAATVPAVIPEEETAPAPGGESGTFQVRTENGTVTLTAPDLSVTLRGSSELTVTLGGLSLEDAYPTNLTSSRPDICEYNWAVRFCGEETYEIATCSFAYSPGTNEQKALDQMQHTLWYFDESSSMSQYVAAAYITHDRNSITWSCRIPSPYKIDLTKLESVAVNIYTPNTQPEGRTYLPGKDWQGNFLAPLDRSVHAAPPAYGTVTTVSEISAQAPLWDTGITREQVGTVTFLDTVASAPAECWDVSKKQDGSVVAWAEKTGSLYDLYLAAEGGIDGKYCTESMFSLFVNLTEICFNGAFHTDSAENFFGMFMCCLKLEKVDMASIQTGKAYSMSNMFNACTALTELDLSHFDTGNVTDMHAMFASCQALRSLNLQSFDLSNVTDLGWMFQDCPLLENLVIPPFDPFPGVEHNHFRDPGATVNGQPWEELFR